MSGAAACRTRKGGVGDGGGEGGRWGDLSLAWRDEVNPAE